MISVEMQGGRICLLFVVGAVMGQSIRKLQNFLVFSHANLHNFLSTMMAIYAFYVSYCMREMLAKVPEGEWLCEECKSVERVGHGRQEMIGRMDENEKNNSSGQASSEYVNSSDAGRRNKGFTRTPCKRHRDDDDTEVSSLGKKPALESLVGSPKISNTSKTAALTRDTSLKNLDKGRHSSSDTVPVNDITESASSASDHRAHNIRGSICKLYIVLLVLTLTENVIPSYSIILYIACGFHPDKQLCFNLQYYQNIFPIMQVFSQSLIHLVL